MARLSRSGRGAPPASPVPRSTTMKTLMTAAALTGSLAALSVAAVPALSQAQEVYGTLGYAGSRAEGADTGAVQGRLGAKLTPHFGVEGELSGGVKDDNIDQAGVPGSR